MNGTSFDLTVHVTLLPAQTGGLDQILCPVCHEPLNLHQPEPEIPHRILASCTCEECGLWYSLIVSPDRTEVFMVRLPVLAEIREVLVRKGLE